jgi:hypothetical protein
MDADPDAREVVEAAMALEGLIRQDGIHAAAVVIADRPLVDYLPLQQRGADKEIVTQFNMNEVAELGLLKMDFLGLRNLDVLQDAVKLIEDSRGERVDLTALPLDDEATYRMLAAGDATGVFQFESGGMREALREVRPTEFSDLIALVALYRPGPMANIPIYAARKNGREPVTYDDPRLEEILGETYSLIVFQEQLMSVSKILAGFTPGQADTLRKAVSKKKRDVIEQLKPELFEGCERNGVPRKVAERFWRDVEAAGDYSFNKSHAACYALIAYQTAYLKANYTAEYMAALLSSVMHTKDRVPFYVNACRETGVEVLPPDVNESGVDFRVVEGRIRFGLTAVKGVGEGAVREIVAEREKAGPFRDLFDFCCRVDCAVANKRVLEALVMAGAFDSTGASRKGLLEVLPAAAAAGQKAQADAALGQGSFFDMLGGGGPSGDADAGAEGGGQDRPPVSAEEFSGPELLRLEKSVVGFYLSGHPLEPHREVIDRFASHTLVSAADAGDGDVVTIVASVASVAPRQTRKGDPMAIVGLEDLTGSAELVVYPSAWNPVPAGQQQPRWQGNGPFGNGAGNGNGRAAPTGLDGPPPRELLVPDALVLVQVRVKHRVTLDEGSGSQVDLVWMSGRPFDPDAAPPPPEAVQARGRRRSPGPAGAAVPVLAAVPDPMDGDMAGEPSAGESDPFAGDEVVAEPPVATEPPVAAEPPVATAAEPPVGGESEPFVPGDVHGAPLVVRLGVEGLRRSIVDDLRSLLARHRGRSPVELVLSGTGSERRLRLGPDWRVSPSPALLAALDGLAVPAADSGGETPDITFASSLRGVSP